MDIDLLYQEYQRFAMSQNSVSQQQLRRQRQQQQQGSSIGEDLLLRTIRQALPNLLAPCSPGSSRLSASLPLSASSEEEFQPPPPPPPPPTPPPPPPPLLLLRPKQRYHPAASACRKTLSEPLPPAVDFESATSTAVASTRHHHEAVTSPTTAYEQPEQRQLNRPTVSADAGSKAGKNDPLLVINPKDVKSVLTQVVKATMRDLLGKNQVTREKCLLRQINRTLGEFETSMSAIVKSFATSRCQASAVSQRTARNNSAGMLDSFTVCGVGSGSSGLGAGVCIRAASGSCSKEEAQAEGGMGAGAVSIRDPGQTIRESCCRSDDRVTSSTRVRVRDSDSICGDVLPLRYRHLSSLCCQNCTTISGGSGHRNRRNFNHAKSAGKYGSIAGSEFRFSDCEEETTGESEDDDEEEDDDDDDEEPAGGRTPAGDTATACSNRTSRLLFPRFASDARGQLGQHAPPTQQQLHRRSSRS